MASLECLARQEEVEKQKKSNGFCHYFAMFIVAVS